MKNLTEPGLSMGDLSSEAYNLMITYGPKLILAILTLVIGLWIIKWMTKGLTGIMDRKELDPSLKPFFRSLFNITLKVLLAISVMGMVGIEMTSFIAILAAAGLAIGMALSGTLQNFAGGIMILIFKPYKVGDYIEATGHAGTVKEIQIFNTILTTPDNVRIIIPNGQLSGSTMKNYSAEPKRRVDFLFGIGYDDDIAKAKEILLQTVKADNRIHEDPEPFIALKELGDNSVNFALRVWCDTSEYWPIFFDIQEKVKLEFDKAGINIPYPQRDVHLYNH